MSETIPVKCERCKSPVKPVWNQGRAALKCTASGCEWEISANDYAQRLHAQGKDVESEEEWDE